MVLTLTAARPERTTLSGTMSLKKRRPSVAFSWHKPFAILAPWKKGKGDALLDSEVVLTKMKVLNNFEKLLSLDDSVSTLSLSVSEHGMPELSKAAEVSSVKSAPTGQESKDDYLSAMFSDPQLPRLYKFESEDSGVEMPSGATSPSTPSGSEQSFVVHSRESSCDSRALPSQEPLLLLGDECAEMLEMSDVHQLDETVIAGALETDLTEVDGLAEGEDTEGQFEQETSDSDLERPEDGSLRNPSELCEGESEQQRERGSERPAGEDDTRSRTECPDQACDDAATEGAALRKSTTSDSLDEYMEECCRLSEVSQSRASPLGSGLGYLEHICQLIEKIGQLQEHNLKLQRQICGLQRDARVIKTKEDFFMQHCNCGAASLAFQEVKRHSRSDFPSGTLSDLTTIPEVTHNPLRGVRRDGDSVISPNIPLWRRGLNRRSYTEGEARYLGDSAEVLSAPHRRLSENYTWGKVKELVKKTKLRNQNRLGLSSTSLKNSCPQLYRPDLGPLDLPRRDRNSMIALGHQNKMDFLWAQ
ncbi:uncharacterized protein si:ch211-250c4.3 isoform X2 [Alosa sapidissima]|uniref:uncharacterized protein si:ch211-250c4.3 isoform X2 n=1 Tax=Alosa sapidissima TaxID=34773 RepID=UPI001C09B4AE|nr:uncharacterized protein si:ch211-250c4.3 isoform X2 [Alosa sapidissima]